MQIGTRHRALLRHALPYGLVAAALTLLLQVIEYRWLLIGHRVEIYGGLVAVLFATVGIWVGRQLTRPKVIEQVVERVVETVHVREVPVPASADFVRDDAQVAALGLTRRELEILALIAEGLSTREIAARVFVSENTVKTHASRIFGKLGVQRRVQAVQRGRSLRLIP